MTNSSHATWAKAALADAADTLKAFMADDANAARIQRVSVMIAQAMVSGHKAMICGNGGSSADAMHFAEELTGRFRKERAPLAALACTDPGHLTCVSNDYGYDQVFSRWVSALGKPGDVLIVLSTSGNSRNVVEAVKAARVHDMETVALLGKSGGELKGMCSEEWIVPGADAGRIQEIHMIVLHTLIEGIERTLFPHLYQG